MEFDLANLSPQEGYKLLIGTVVPRPIASVTTLGPGGVVNAALYSFFNALSHDPCLVALGIESRPGGGPKDTARNIRDTLEFVVNMVDEAIAERMNICATDLPPELGELAEAGFTTAASAKVAPPRIAEAPAWLECRRYLNLEIGRGRNIVLGEVVHIAFRDRVVDPAKFSVDRDRYRPIGRLAGTGYVTQGTAFDMARVSVADLQSRRTNAGDETK